MGKGLIEIGRVRPGHHFQADRYSFGERKRRRERSVFVKQADWWRAASPMERASRVLHYAVCAAFGLTGGFILVVIASGLFA